MQLNRDELRKKLSREYVGDQLGFLVAEAKALIRSGNARLLEEDHFEAMLIDHGQRKKALLTVVPTVRPF